MKFQSPGSGLRLFYHLAKLYGGNSNWYRGKNWAFRTRWRLILFEKAAHSFARSWLTSSSIKPTIGGGNLWIAGFLRKVFIYILVYFGGRRSSSWPVLFCIVSVSISYL